MARSDGGGLAEVRARCVVRREPSALEQGGTCRLDFRFGVKGTEVRSGGFVVAEWPQKGPWIVMRARRGEREIRGYTTAESRFADRVIAAKPARVLVWTPCHRAGDPVGGGVGGGDGGVDEPCPASQKGQAPRSRRPAIWTGDAREERSWWGCRDKFERFEARYRGVIRRAIVLRGLAAELDDVYGQFLERVYLRWASVEHGGGDPPEPGGRGPLPYRNYLLVILRYCVDDSRRRSDAQGDARAVAGREREPHEHLLEIEARDRCQLFINRLPPLEQAVLTLRHGSGELGDTGMTAHEIGGLLGITPGAVYQATYRARRRASDLDGLARAAE